MNHNIVRVDRTNLQIAIMPVEEGIIRVAIASICGFLFRVYVYADRGWRRRPLSPRLSSKSSSSSRVAAVSSTSSMRHPASPSTCAPSPRATVNTWHREEGFDTTCQLHSGLCQDGKRECRWCGSGSGNRWWQRCVTDTLSPGNRARARCSFSSPSFTYHVARGN